MPRVDWVSIWTDAERCALEEESNLGNGVDDAADGQDPLDSTLLVVTNGALCTRHLPYLGHVLAAFADDGSGLRTGNDSADVDPGSLVMGIGRLAVLNVRRHGRGSAADRLGVGRIRDNGIALGILTLLRLILLAVRLDFSIRLGGSCGVVRFSLGRLGSWSGFVFRLLFLVAPEDFVQSRPFGVWLIVPGWR